MTNLGDLSRKPPNDPLYSLTDLLERKTQAQLPTLLGIRWALKRRKTNYSTTLVITDHLNGVHYHDY